MSVDVGLTLPILEGETPENAIKRVDEIIFAAIIQKIDELRQEGRAIVEGG